VPSRADKLGAGADALGVKIGGGLEALATGVGRGAPHAVLSNSAIVMARIAAALVKLSSLAALNARTRGWLRHEFAGKVVSPSPQP